MDTHRMIVFIMKSEKCMVTKIIIYKYLNDHEPDIKDNFEIGDICSDLLYEEL